MAGELLTVWNPWFEPQTIQVHVEILRRRQTSGPRRVWWARLFRSEDGKPLPQEVIDKKFWTLRKLVAEARAANRDLVLYATNFQSLHALHVVRVIFGSELPPGEEAFAPTYYTKHEARPAIWFEVRDIRALSFDAIDTSRFFLDYPNDRGFAFDPYAAFWHWYPIRFDGPSVPEIFDRSRLPAGKELFADLPDTIYPPEVEKAKRELSRTFGKDWNRLEEKSRVFLSTAWLVFGRHSHSPGFDLSAALSGVARALETEICESIFEPLLELARERLGSDADERVFGDAPRRLTMGIAARRLPEIEPLAAELDLVELRSLSRDRSFRRWLDRFVHVRNQLSHAGEVKPAVIRARFSDIVASAGDSRLIRLLPAKEELAARGSQTVVLGGLVK